ncbi:putative ankyrin repeat protein RF_0381 [Microplitis demolitor]|uniref:putative ankyrin repeat protein RF_0381 n=1 Tax=Microplitis demolitor TaxID=69319 RepID=UPI0004CD68C3|nr:putative ankyrin repeat protein RF_0381 [Microplitis demolitor]
MNRSKYTYKYVYPLIKYGIIKDVNTELYSTERLPLLHIAVSNCDERLVDCLLNNGADTNVNIWESGTPLHLAVAMENLEITKRLIKFGVNVNAQTLVNPWFIPLHTAILKNNTEIAEFLIKNGADVNFELEVDNPRYRGKTMLNLAIFKGHEEMVKLLLKHKADPNILTPGHGSSLAVAARTKNVAIMKLLLAYGADINYAPSSKSNYLTPLNMAIIKQDLKAVDLLLNNNMININPATQQTLPVLHVGVIFITNCCIIQRLLDAGVDVNLEAGGQTVLDPVTVYRPNAVRQHVQYIIKKHIVKLRAANFYVSKKNLAAVDSKDLKDLHNQCIIEIEQMKKINIGLSNLTFYDVLHKSRHDTPE